LLAAIMQAQSLGDIARQQKHKKAQQTAPVSNKVLTNDDLSVPGSGSDSKPVSPKSVQPPEPVEPKSKTKSPDELKNKIDNQKEKIALLQDAIDKLQGSIQYVQNNRTSIPMRWSTTRSRSGGSRKPINFEASSKERKAS
jgi:hypothetical protein